MSRLRLLHKHDALIILKYSLSLPSLLHNLRSAYCWDNQKLVDFDAELRVRLKKIMNVALEEDQWVQATLPVKDGGLGLRRTCQVAPSTVLASAFGSSTLISAILPNTHISTMDPLMNTALVQWSSMAGTSLPATGTSAGVQRNWDRPIITATKDVLFTATTDDYSRARLLAVTAPQASDWLNAPPLTAVGLRMPDETIRVAVGLRLGSKLCAPHICPCGQQSTLRGHMVCPARKSWGIN